MKILLVSFSTRGAMGDYFFLLAQELAKKESVILMAPSYFNRKIENAEIFRFKMGNSKSASFFYLLNPVAIIKILKFIKKEKPDIVHLIFGEGYPPMLILAPYLKRKKIPLIITIHDPEIHPGGIIDKINGFLRKFVIKSATGIHIHSELFREKIRKMGVDDNKIFIIPHGSFAPLFEKYKNSNIEKENWILFFGRLEKYKGLEYFIEAGLKFDNNFKFIIAGPGKLDEKLLDKIKQNSNKFILINKFLSNEEVANLFQKSRVCVLPYIQATQSSVPLISAYFDVPVVATKVGNFVEEIPLINGALVDPQNSDSLVEGIYKAIGLNPIYPKDREFSNLSNRYVEFYKTTKNNFLKTQSN